MELRRDAARALIERYDKSLRRTARRFSLCADDAEDAYQRALEILLRKAPVIEPSRLVRWMHTVTRHEAYAVRRQRGRGKETTVAQSEEGYEVDAVELVASDAPGPDESTERHERLVRSREALKALKPNEVRALTLKAEGYSYVEIAEMTGWSRTKINRLMVEGRRRFLDTFDDIEQGRRCEQLSGSLSAFCDGEITDAQRPALLEHLGQCPRCRAQLRAFRGVPRRVLEIAPIGMLAGPSVGERMGDRLAAGVDRTRELATAVLHRGGTSAADATQSVAAGGGTRGSGLAIIGVVCGLGAAGGGAAVCVDQGVLNNPLGGGDTPTSVEKEPPVVDPPVAPAPDPMESAAPVAAPAPEPPAPESPRQVRERELGIEAPAPTPAASSEFGGPSSGGGSSGGASGGGGSGGFGFEK